jgi:hypothetical protein
LGLADRVALVQAGPRRELVTDTITRHLVRVRVGVVWVRVRLKG